MTMLLKGDNAKEVWNQLKDNEKKVIFRYI